MGEPLALLKLAVGAGGVTGKNIVSVVKAEPGLTTVTQAVPGEAMLGAGTCALSSLPLTKVVVSPTPFHWTAAPDTKSVPLTVSVKPGPPGAALSGHEGLVDERYGIHAAILAKLTVCWLPATPPLLSVMVRVPVSEPVAVGEKSR